MKNLICYIVKWDFFKCEIGFVPMRYKICFDLKLDLFQCEIGFLPKPYSDSWYKQGLIVQTQTHGIESVLLNHTCTRRPSVTRIRVCEWCSQSWEALLSMGPTPSSFQKGHHVGYQKLRKFTKTLRKSVRCKSKKYFLQLSTKTIRFFSST